MPHIKFFLSTNPHPDIIIVTETWLNPSITDSMVHIDGFSLYRNDRKLRVGGGVAIYAKTPIKFVQIYSSPSDCLDGSIEYLIGKISLSAHQDVLVAAVYRPPACSFTNSDFLPKLAALTPNFSTKILMGDFNVDMLSSNSASIMLRSFLAENNLRLVPHGITNITSERGTHIDLCIADKEDIITSFSKTSTPFINSHHLIQAEYSIFKFSPFLETKFSYRQLSSVSQNSFLTYLDSLNWTEFYNLQNVDAKLSILHSFLIGALDLFAPQIHVHPGHKMEPWITKDLFVLQKQVTQAYRRYRRKRSAPSRSIYRHLKAELDSKTASAQINFYKTRLQNLSDPKQIWRELKNLGLTDSSPPKQPVCSPQQLNSFFVSVSKSPSVTFPPPQRNLSPSAAPVYPPFSFRNISMSELNKSLTHFSSQATGPDGIPLRVIKLAFPAIKNHLLHLFNFSLESALFPSNWKLAFIIPINKIPNPSEPSDYRPISLLSTLSKILEKCVSLQIVSHLTLHNIIDPFQSGFRPGFSTESCLVRLLDDIKLAKSRKMITALILFDYSKAFDKVNYSILCAKLENYGFDAHAVGWLQSYLRDRKQQVVIGKSTYSDWESPDNGVPQGSVLGPLLFLIYINDIGRSLKFCNRLLFADDLQIYLSFPLHDMASHLELLQCDITSLAEWCNINALSLNAKKTKLLFFGPSNHTRAIYRDLQSLVTKIGVIDVAKKAKNLGVIMDCDLTWEPQVLAVVGKVKSALYRLKRMSPYTDLTLRTKLVQSLIFPIFDYCAMTYGDLTSSLDSKLQVTLNSCVRYVFELGVRTHVTQYRLQLGWLSARNRRLQLSAGALHKTLLSSSPDYLSSRLHFQTRQRPSRISGPQLSIPFTTSAQYASSPLPYISKFWNSLPPTLRLSDSLPIFKSQLRSFLLRSENPSLSPPPLARP